MINIYWNIANKNPYIMLQCEGYEKRHGRTFLRKWWYLIKALYTNNQHYSGKILKTEEMYHLVDSHDIISFDIFDTLLVRPFERPTDLFFELEKREGIKNFANKRIEAEKKAREKYRKQEDVTLNQIYHQIEDKYKKLKKKEMELEEEVLFVNKFVYEIYQYALSKKKKIIICSDMYLPKNFLKSVLYKKGYQGFEKIYISSDVMMTKSSGNLFKHILHELNVSNTTMIHIGDNLESDGNASVLCGISYICVKELQFIKIERTK